MDEVTLPPQTVAALMAPRHISVSDIGGATKQGLTRDRNEDAWAFESGQAFVVADGMGGREAGDVAAQATVEAMLTQITVSSVDWREAVDAVNAAVVAAGAAHDVDSLGAVAVALRCVADRVTLVHVGDARAYRLRGGSVQQLTRDHSIAEAIADLGIRRSDSGLPARELGALTSYFGSPGSADEFSVHELTVQAGDRIVLCSDGVHGSVDLGHWRTAGTAVTAGHAARRLVEDARAAGAGDDCTALVVDLDTSSAADERRGAG